MTDAKPYPKAQQLGRGVRRYRRKVASQKQWQAIIAAKIGPCRVCLDPCSNGRLHGRVQFHHLIPRDRGGDDVADNIVPLCIDCHTYLHDGDASTCRALCASLTDAEYAHAVDKAGENVWESVYGIRYER